MVRNPFGSHTGPPTPEPPAAAPSTPPPPEEPLDEHTWRALFNGFESHNFPDPSSSGELDELGNEKRYLIFPRSPVKKWKKEIFHLLLVERIGKENVGRNGNEFDGTAFWRVSTRFLQENQFVENPVIEAMFVDEPTRLKLWG